MLNQVADAVQSAGGKYDGVKFAGFDTGEKAIEWFKSDSKSHLIGLVSQNPYMIGYQTVQVIDDIANGREVEKEIIVTGEWITAESIQ